LSGFFAFVVPISPVSLVTDLTLSERVSAEGFALADAAGLAHVGSAFAVAAGAFAEAAVGMVVSCVWVVL
jgi:hypothetical protein